MQSLILSGEGPHIKVKVTKPETEAKVTVFTDTDVKEVTLKESNDVTFAA